MIGYGPMRRSMMVVSALLLACASCSGTDSPGGGSDEKGDDAVSVPAEDSGSDALVDASVREGGGSGLDASSKDGSSNDAGDSSVDGSLVDAQTPVDPLIEGMHARADQALETLMLSYWPKLSANTTTYDWMYAHYWDAVLDAAERRGKNAFSGTARMFFDLQNQRGWLDGFYDDENWVTLALLHSYRVTGETIYLDQAKIVFADIMKAWDTTCCGTHKGGLYWQKPATNKVTAINAGAVVSASRLYEATQDATYLAFAKKTYDFWSTNMVDGATGHVYDGMDNTGAINTVWNFTYNEGLFIGAIVELSRVTQDTSRLPLAHEVASYLMSKEIESTSLGTIMSDGKCSGDGEMFKAVGARYLGELYATDTSHGEYRDFLHRSGDAVWTLARDPASGHVSCDWAGPFDGATGDVGSLGSAANGLSAAAKALGAGAQRPPLRYEAEEGNLHGIGLETSHPGFSGWAYLAGWGSDGQSVDFIVDVNTAGDYKVAFRYATGDAAKRTVRVNGTDAVAALDFTSTGSYDVYNTVTTTVKLPVGRSTLSVAYAASKGGTGYLNLDRADLSL